ncbi:SusC/RagA family TonB-linked outer membrane protein [Marinifilum flexuosum]|uniref:SusC/RagA family TonB-linked outer membrane protein n=1 Tax=Marinifilum flexuosum TaxID=1117708 RepID=UPI0024907194|nr:TonB-dependent receptor [Marinifilum flexuosum]
MKRLKIILLFLFLGLQSFAQTQITGTISGTDGLTLPGVNVLVKGTSVGTTTDINGKYTIEVPVTEAVLLYSFIGFESQEISIGNQKVIDVVLQQSTESLEEVVVVGYGEVRKRDVTGSISKVKESENVARQYSSVDALLQGRSSGVQVVSNPGSPGAAVSVRIRGTNSLRGNNEPLYVVDGVIISSAGEDVLDASTDANELQAPQNGLTGLNPRDIESIEILKDASATAIYGSRGANGVVLITTKQGEKGDGKAKINAYGSVEFSWISKKLDMLDGVGYAKYRNETALLEGNKVNFHISPDNKVYDITYVVDPNTGIESPVIAQNPMEDKNWQDEVYEMGITHTEGVTVSGKGEKSKYYFSAGFADQKGIVETSQIQRGDLRLNMTNELTDKLELDTRVSMMYQDGSFAQSGSKSGGNRSFTKQVLSYTPLVGFGDEDSDDLDLDVSNPYAWLTDYQDETKELRINASSSLTYELAKGLKYKIQGGLDYRNKDRSRFWNTGVFKGQKENGVLAMSTLDRYSYTMDNLLMYNTKLNDNHRINTTVGVTFDGSHAEASVYEVTDFPIKSLGIDAPELGRIITQPLDKITNEESILSFLGRVNYSLMDKYVFTVSFRADGSSKFADGNKYGYFPAAAFAWRMIEEDFVKDLNVFENLKLRMGWGQTGNQAIDAYSTLKNYNTVYYVDSNNNTSIGNVAGNISNPDLTWETTTQYNAGLDMSFFRGRLSLVTDVYYKRTEDLLQEIQIGSSNGFSTMPINRGEIENKGIELSLDGIIIDKKDISLNVGGHISFNRNKVVELGLDPSSVWNNGVESKEVFYLGNNVSTGTYFKAPANIFMEGKAVGMLWGYKTNGIYQDEAAASEGPTYQGNANVAGDVVFVDQNGDGNINELDRTFIGDPNPDFTYGFNINFNYKRFTASALFEGVYGNQIANGNSMEIAFAEGNSKNVLSEAYYNAWRPGAPSNSHPRVGYDLNEVFTDRIVEDGSYFRMSNITLGYDLPVESLGLSKVNLYVTGRNLFTITDYSGYDPQVTSFMYDGTIMGVDWTGTPNAKSFLVGLNVTF